MRISTRNTRKPLQVLAGAFAVAFTPSLCRAQEPQAATPPLQQPQAALLLDENTLGGEAQLLGSVTFEARRQKLPDVLAALQAQSGVTLSVAPGSLFASKLLTARARAMPLARVMASLSHLYGAAWVKRGTAFEMRSNERSDIENAAWKLPSTFTNALKAAQADPIDWDQEVANLGVNRLRQKGGIALDELPDDIVQKLRKQLEARDVTQLGVELDKLRLQNLIGATLKVSDNSMPTANRIRMRLFLPDEKLVGESILDVAPDAK